MNEMKFIDEEHKKFWNEKYKEMKELGKTDVYYKALVYVLGICETTRKNFDEIFDLKNGEINIDSLQGAYQTGTSIKVTRMAFNLWNNCMYDSQEDIDKGRKSSGYSPSEIFDCSYAPFFFEGIKIRYPEYTREQQVKNDINAVMYMRVGNIEQLDYYVKEEIENKVENVVGLYIRSGQKDGEQVNNDIYLQQEKLEKFCKDNNIHNKIFYIDVRQSGISTDRKALKQMSEDIDKGIINKVIVTSPSKLYRDITNMCDFIGFTNYRNVEIYSLDSGNINNNLYGWLIQNKVKETLKDEETEELENSESIEDEDMEY